MSTEAQRWQVPAGFVLLKAGVERDISVIEREIVELVRERIGPVAAFKTVLTVNRLPKTRSGKILVEITATLKAKGFPSVTSEEAAA